MLKHKKPQPPCQVIDRLMNSQEGHLRHLSRHVLAFLGKRRRLSQVEVKLALPEIIMEEEMACWMTIFNSANRWFSTSMLVTRSVDSSQKF